MFGRIQQLIVSMRSLSFYALALSLLLSGCSGKEEEAMSDSASSHPQASAPEAEETDSTPVARTADWTGEVRLVSVTHPQWLRELEALRGDIVVVDNWATWCAPCLERFPLMMAMADEWQNEGVRFVSLSLDDRDDPDSIEQAREFLESQDAKIPNYLMDEAIPDAFDKLDLLGIPAVFVYDREGNLTHRLTGDDPNRQYTEADVEEAIRSLVGASE